MALFGKSQGKDDTKKTGFFSFLKSNDKTDQKPALPKTSLEKTKPADMAKPATDVIPPSKISKSASAAISAKTEPLLKTSTPLSNVSKLASNATPLKTEPLPKISGEVPVYKMQSKPSNVVPPKTEPLPKTSGSAPAYKIPSMAPKPVSNAIPPKPAPSLPKKPQKGGFFSFFKKKPRPFQNFSDRDVEIEKIVDLPKSHREADKTSAETKDILSPKSILDSIVEKSGVNVEDTLILGPKPPVRPFPSRVYGIEKKLQFSKFIFKIVLLVSVISVGFFVFQLQPNLPYLHDYLGYSNLTQRNKELKEETYKTQNEINFKNYYITQVNIDRFIYLADSYEFGKIARVGVDDSKMLEEMKEVLALIKKGVSQSLLPSGVENPYMQSEEVLAIEDPLMAQDRAKLLWGKDMQARLNQRIDGQKTIYQESLDEEEAQSQTELLNTLSFLLNSRGKIQTAYSDEDLDNLNVKSAREISKTFHAVNKNISIISQIKDQRVNWTEQLQRIWDITSEVDIFFKSGDPDLQRINYRNYSFNAKTNTITVSGEIQTDDPHLFNEVLKFYETFEASPYFKVTNEIRAFSKSERDNKYSTGINLNLEILDVEEPLDGAENGSEGDSEELTQPTHPDEASAVSPFETPLETPSGIPSEAPSEALETS